MEALGGKPVTSRRPAAFSHRAQSSGLPSSPTRFCPLPTHIYQAEGKTLLSSCKGTEAYHLPLLDRYAAKKNIKTTFLIPFPSSSCSSFNLFPWKATGRVIRRRTLHIESHLPPWRGHLGPENNECLTKTNKHKIAGGRRKGPLSDCFFPFILAGQGSSEAGLICLALGMHRVCSVPWRVLNNHRISKYLHSITVLGQNLLGWVTLGTLSPLSSEELLTNEAVSFPPLGGWWVLLQPGHSSAFKWPSWDPTMKCLPTLTAETQRAWLPELIRLVISHYQPLGFFLSLSSFPCFSSLSQAKINPNQILRIGEFPDMSADSQGLEYYGIRQKYWVWHFNGVVTQFDGTTWEL